MNKNLMRCAVCKKSRSYGSKNSFHRFPEDPKTLKTWLCILGLKSKSVSNNPYICSSHFLAHHIKKEPDGSCNLTSSALPIIPFRSNLNEEIDTMKPDETDTPEKADSEETVSIDFDTRDDIVRKQRKSRHRIPPDICYSLAKRNWTVAKSIILRQRRRIEALHDVLRQLESAVDTMSSSVKELEVNLLKSSCVKAYSSGD